MIYHDMDGEPQFMELEEVYDILSEYCCTGRFDEDETHATFGYSIEKVEGAMEIARALVAAKRDEIGGGLIPQ